jgi:2-polyprenyl-3-methyl-5-hydroxy-6-metoxy-1,4-benzoquinol methylase
MENASNERSIINAVASDSWYEEPTGVAMIRHCFKVFRRYISSNDRVLEMGPAEGTMTELLLRDGLKIEAVEGSSIFVATLRDRFPSLIVHEALFEEFAPSHKFDVIILGHVLEHVADPVAILLRVRDWLVPETGRVLIAVPNARSLHRQAAVVMGLISSEYAMSEKDHHHGHRRIYNPETLRADFIAAELRIEFFGGYWLKPLSDRQLEQQWTPEQLAAYMTLGERYPDIAAEIVVVASRVGD